MHLSVESTRQIMIGVGYWHPKKGSTACAHWMRERRSRFGELIQIDVSPHDWFEGRSASCTPLVFIDDANGSGRVAAQQRGTRRRTPCGCKLTQLRFMPTETAPDYLRVLHDHILAHGIPVALYSNKHSIFRINAQNADPEAETQFARAARELGIASIHAHRLRPSLS